MKQRCQTYAGPGQRHESSLLPGSPWNAGAFLPRASGRTSHRRWATISSGRGFAPTLLLLLAFASLLSGCLGLTTTSGTPDAEIGPPPFPKRTTPIHAVLKDGTSRQLRQGPDRVHEVHILAITDNAQSTIEHEKPGDGQKYWSVRIGIKNAGESAILSGTWALTGSDGKSYPRTVVLGLGSDYKDFVSIQPGATMEGTIAFEIPKDITPKQLRYRVDHLTETGINFDAV